MLFRAVRVSTTVRRTRTTTPPPAESGSQLARRSRLRCRGPMPLDGQIQEPLYQLAVADPRGLPELGVHRDRREARDRVDLVQPKLFAAQEEVHASHPRAVDGQECGDGHALDPLRYRR